MCEELVEIHNLTILIQHQKYSVYEWEVINLVWKHSKNAAKTTSAKCDVIKSEVPDSKSSYE